MMCANIKAEPSDFNNTDILKDNEIEQIGQEVKEIIELLNDNEDEIDDIDVDDELSTDIRYPGLASKSIKRDHDKNGMVHFKCL